MRGMRAITGSEQGQMSGLSVTEKPRDAAITIRSVTDARTMLAFLFVADQADSIVAQRVGLDRHPADRASILRYFRGQQTTMLATPRRWIFDRSRG